MRLQRKLPPKATISKIKIQKTMPEWSNDKFPLS